MIGIRESVSNIDAVKTQHVEFIKKHVKRTILFYLETFKFLKTMGYPKRTTNEEINDEIFKIKQAYDSTDYKNLLNSLLRTGVVIKNKENIHLINVVGNRIDASKNVNLIIKCLEDLLVNYEFLLELDFEVNFQGMLTRYEALSKKHKPIIFLLSRIFDYDWFLSLEPTSEWGTYQLTKTLNLNCCTYCNRLYTFTIQKVGNKKLTRPQLDHFLPKAQHPLLALSFFNLIPSCYVCNSNIKGSVEISYEKYLNPYEKNDNHSLIRFSYIPKNYKSSIGLDNNIEVQIKYTGDLLNTSLKRKVEGNIKLFSLKELYLNHADSIQEIIRKKSISGDTYIETLQRTFPSLNLSIEEAYQLAYGNYYNEIDFHKRPLSKMTKDIAIELGELIEYKNL